MKKYTDPLQPDTYYHVYNRGNNGDDIYFEDRNYAYFLQQYRKYVAPVVDTYAYCQMKNHFHFLVRVKSVEVVAEAGEVPKSSVSVFDDFSKTISNQWAKLFNSYTQGMNKV